VSTSDTTTIQGNKNKVKDVSTRQKALEFAKHIPRPPPPSKKSADLINEDQYK